MRVRKVGVMCGAKWYRPRDWKTYGLFKKIPGIGGFRVGPILFWDGS